MPPGERRMEGPFGDHYGHYSEASPFPVFHVQDGHSPPGRDLSRGRGRQAAAGRQVDRPRRRRDDRSAHPGGEPEHRGPLRQRRRGVPQPPHRVGEGAAPAGVVQDGAQPPRHGAAGAHQVRGDGAATTCRCGASGARCANSGTASTRGTGCCSCPIAPLDTLDYTSFEMHVGSKLVLDATGEVVTTDAPPTAHRGPGGIRPADRRTPRARRRVRGGAGEGASRARCWSGSCAGRGWGRSSSWPR